MLSHSTVRIEVKYIDGYAGIGTGLLYQFQSTNKLYVPAIVTNKHVLEKAKILNLVFNPSGQDNIVDFKVGKIGFQLNF